MLVLNAVWVPLTESALIARYVPVWNSIVPGFGNHAPARAVTAQYCCRDSVAGQRSGMASGCLLEGGGREERTFPEKP